MRAYRASTGLFNCGMIVMIRRLLLGIMPALLAGSAYSYAEEAKPEKVSFYSDIRPIFQAQWHGCQQPAKAKGEYVMTLFAYIIFILVRV